MSFSKICLSRFAPLRSPNSLSAFPFSLPVPLTRALKLTCAQHISCSCSASSSSSSSSTHQKGASTRWRPMCLYFTQGKCTMVTFCADPLLLFAKISYLFCIWFFSLSNFVLHITCSIKCFNECTRTSFLLWCKVWFSQMKAFICI